MSNISVKQMKAHENLNLIEGRKQYFLSLSPMFHWVDEKGAEICFISFSQSAMSGMTNNKYLK